MENLTDIKQEENSQFNSQTKFNYKQRISTKPNV